jgi:hypothetical protein
MWRLKLASSYNLGGASTRELFRIFAHVLNELRSRKITRSTNNPVADYAEYLCSVALSLERAKKSTKGFDAVDSMGRKYEIKARRMTAHNSSRQLSALRELDKGHFTFLAGILFREDFSIMKGCLIPHAEVLKRAVYKQHVNAWILHLEDNIWQIPGVQDISELLLRAESRSSV